MQQLLVSNYIQPQYHGACYRTEKADEQYLVTHKITSIYSTWQYYLICYE